MCSPPVKAEFQSYSATLSVPEQMYPGGWPGTVLHEMLDDCFEELDCRSRVGMGNRLCQVIKRPVPLECLFFEIRDPVWS